MRGSGSKTPGDWNIPRPRLGLRSKVLLIIAAPMLALAVGGALLMAAHEARQMRHGMLDHTRAVVRALEQDFERAHLLDDQHVAAEISDRLQSFEQVQRLWLEDAEGAVLYAYTRPGLKTLPPPAAGADAPTVINRDGLWLTQALETSGRAYARLHVQADTSPLYRLIAQRFAMIAGGAAAAALLCVAVALALQRLITRPIIDLAAVARRVTERDDFSLRAEKRTHDELGDLVGSFNAMLEHIQQVHGEVSRLNAELEQRVIRRTVDLERANTELQTQMTQRERLQSQLMAASRQAGMAEIATGVLHNVGNVLNSINVSASLLEEHLRDDKPQNVRRLADLLQEQRGDLPGFFTTERGRQLPAFLTGLADYLQEQQDLALREAQRLTESIDHVKRVVSAQQSIARGTVVNEPVDLTEAIEEALRIQLSKAQHGGVEVTRQFEPVPRVVTDRHAVLQILINLLSNACKALGYSDRPQKRLTVRLLNAPPHGAPAVCVEVIDNGIGIEPEQLTRIFTFGYSGFEGGHGFGLHGAANAARQLRGALTAASDGRDRGARFRLQLPVTLAPEDMAA